MAQEDEVINTTSGHEIRASVKSFLVMLDPGSLFFYFLFISSPFILAVMEMFQHYLKMTPVLLDLH